MNLLTYLHSIFQDEDSLGREEEVEVSGLEEDFDAARLKDTFNGGEQDSKEQEDEEEEEGHEGHEEGVGVTGLLQDLHPHTNLGVATSFTCL
jgi:hypothetical protein